MAPIKFAELNFQPSDFNTGDALAQGIAGAADNFFKARTSIIQNDSEKIRQESERLKQEADKREMLAKYGRFSGVKPQAADNGQQVSAPAVPDVPSLSPQDTIDKAGELVSQVSGIGGVAPAPGRKVSERTSISGPQGFAKAPDEGVGLPSGDIPEVNGSEIYAAPDEQTPMPTQVSDDTVAQMKAHFANDPRAAAASFLSAGFTPREIERLRAGKINDDPALAEKVMATGEIAQYYGTETPEFKMASQKVKVDIAKMQQDRQDTRLASKLSAKKGEDERKFIIQAYNATTNAWAKTEAAAQAHNVLNKNTISDSEALTAFTRSVAPMFKNLVGVAKLDANDPDLDKMLNMFIDDQGLSLSEVGDREAAVRLLSNRDQVVKDLKGQVTTGGASKLKPAPSSELEKLKNYVKAKGGSPKALADALKAAKNDGFSVTEEQLK